MPSNATKNKLRKKAAEFTDKLRQPINVLKVHLKVYNFTGNACIKHIHNKIRALSFWELPAKTFCILPQLPYRPRCKILMLRPYMKHENGHVRHKRWVLVEDHPILKTRDILADRRVKKVAALRMRLSATDDVTGTDP